MTTVCSLAFFESETVFEEKSEKPKDSINQSFSIKNCRTNWLILKNFSAIKDLIKIWQL